MLETMPTSAFCFLFCERQEGKSSKSGRAFFSPVSFRKPADTECAIHGVKFHS